MSFVIAFFKVVYMSMQDGPDILVCDEAHIIKNTKADVTHALKQVKCQRRIALTGSPLQNNLMEYYCVSLYKSYNLETIKLLHTIFDSSSFYLK